MPPLRKRRARDEEEEAGLAPAPGLPRLHETNPRLPSAGLRESGEPLPAAVRAHFEPRLEQDLGQVRVHNSRPAAAAARAVGARAFTAGGHIVFAEGQYAPETVAGRCLLAHELAHVAQQAGQPAAWIQRQIPGPGEGNPPIPGAQELIDTDLGTDIRMIQRPSVGEAVITYRGREWFRLRWTPQAGRRLDETNLVIIRDVSPRRPRLAIAFQSTFRINAIVNLAVEQYACDVAQRSVDIEHRFSFTGTVSVTLANGTTVSNFAAPLVRIDSYNPGPPPPTTIEGERGEILAPEIPPTVAPEQPRPRSVVHRVWSFDSAAKFEAFAASHPDTNWAGIATLDGKYIAYALTEEALRRLADSVRQARYDFEPLREYPNGRIASLFLRGQALASVNDLRNLYFREGFLAGIGPADGPEEAEVFRMGSGSFGRKPLTHDQALARWRELDALTAAEIERLQSRARPGLRGAGSTRGGPAALS